MQFNLDLAHKTIDDENLRWVEIYRITNKITDKVYIGQAVSHRKNYNKYSPNGTMGRFKEHIKESKPKQKYHCNALNNAIRTYGVTNFMVEVLHYCKIEDANKMETNEIAAHNSLVPNGYNINTSCNSLLPSKEMRDKISVGNISTHFKKHLFKFEGFVFKDDEPEFYKYITPRTTNGVQIGWYLRLNRKVIEFKSSMQDLNTTKQRACEFLKILKERNNEWQHDQIARNPLEPSLPPSFGNE